MSSFNNCTFTIYNDSIFSRLPNSPNVKFTIVPDCSGVSGPVYGSRFGLDLSGSRPRLDVSGALIAQIDVSGAQIDVSGAAQKLDLSGAQINLSGAAQIDVSGALIAQIDVSGALIAQTDVSGALIAQTDVSGAQIDVSNQIITKTAASADSAYTFVNSHCSSCSHCSR